MWHVKANLEKLRGRGTALGVLDEGLGYEVIELRTPIARFGERRWWSRLLRNHEERLSCACVRVRVC